MVAAEVGRAALVDLRLAVGLYLIVGDEGEGIRRCRICVNIHTKSYGDIVCRTLQRAAVIVEREEVDDYEEASVQDKGAREGAEVEAYFGRSVSSYYPPPPPP